MNQLAPAPSSTAEGLLTELQLLVERTRSVDIRQYEISGSGTVLESLATRILDIGLDGRRLLERVAWSYGSGDQAPFAAPAEELEVPGFDLLDLDLHELDIPALRRENLESSNPAGKVSNLACMVRADLGLRLDELSACRSGKASAEKVLVCCASCWRKIQEAAALVEQAVCHLEGFEPRLAYAFGLSDSLASRHAYAEFSLAVLGQGPPDEDEVYDRLQEALDAMTELRGRDVYLSLRLNDRLELHNLSMRIRTTLAISGDRRDAVRLWHDVAGLARIVRKINDRSELVAHDRELLERLWKSIESEGLSCDDDETGLAYRAAQLFGRDLELDRLLIARSTEQARWLACLERLRMSLGL